MVRIMHGKLKTLAWLGLIPAGLVAVAVAAAAIEYHLVKKADIRPAAAPMAALESPDKVSLGGAEFAELTVECPWNIRPVLAEVNPAEGCQLVGEPSIKLSSVGWGRWEWSVRAELTPYRMGKMPEGEIRIEFSGGARALTAVIPGFEAEALTLPPGDSALELAGDIKRLKESWRGFIWRAAAAAAVLIVAATLVWLVVKRRNRRLSAAVLPPWALALSELRELRGGLEKGELSGGVCVSRLTDIVRIYLARNFRLRVRTQTTSEFLRDLDRPGGVLPERQRQFLRDFLSAAELVKFAKLPIAGDSVEDAIQKAEILVEETKPSESGGPGND